MIDHYKLCPTCGNFSHSMQREEYCIMCGTKLIEECRECHGPITYPIAKFCPECGAALVDIKPPQTVSSKIAKGES